MPVYVAKIHMFYHFFLSTLPCYVSRQTPSLGDLIEFANWQASSTQEAANASLLTIPLNKQYVPVKRGGKTVMYKTAYFGPIFVGAPHAQSFQVVFDTGSGHVVIPAASCMSPSCQSHRKYNRSASASAVDIDNDGNRLVGRISPRDRDEVTLSYGTGDIEGTFVRDDTCIAAAPSATSVDGCASIRVVLARKMTKEPFSSFAFDGILGLGLEALALHPEFSFFGQFTRQHPELEPQFGVFLARDDETASEITFGGHDARRTAAALQWSPVEKPQLGYWMVHIKRVSVGSTLLDVCDSGDCVAIVDTGTSLLGVPRDVLPDMNQLLARTLPSDPGEIDCRGHPGPDLVFDLDGDVQIVLGSEDYSRSAGLRVITNASNTSQFVCRSQLLPVNESPGLGHKTWILGEPALRKYYTAYDWEQKRVGFALAVQPPKVDVDPRWLKSTPKHVVYGAPPKAAPTPTVVVI